MVSSSQYSPLIFGTVIFEIRERENGIKSTRSTLSISKEESIVAIVPANINRYIGNNINCRIRFIGRIDAERGTFPRAIPVKSKYQSVQGVTMSMIKPIHKEGVSFKKKKPRIKANSGLNMKLILALTLVNFQFLKEFFN